MKSLAEKVDAALPLADEQMQQVAERHAEQGGKVRPVDLYAMIMYSQDQDAMTQWVTEFSERVPVRGETAL